MGFEPRAYYVRKYVFELKQFISMNYSVVCIVLRDTKRMQPATIDYIYHNINTKH